MGEGHSTQSTEATLERMPVAAPLWLDEVPASEGRAAWFVARSGHRLRVARFAPHGAPRGSVILSTGRTEPIEKYGEVIGELLARGFVVLAHDWAGQGLSARFSDDPLRNDLIGGCELLVENFRDLLSAHADELPRPWLAVAHSMGAALTALALAEGEHRIALAVLSAPMIEFSVRPLPFWFVGLTVSGMSSLGFGPRLARARTDPAEVPFEANLLTHDRRRYERSRLLYRAHPELRLGEPTWRWLSFAVDLRERLRVAGVAERIACRFCVVGAGDDRIVSTPAIRRFVERVPRGSFEQVPSAFHELLMETDELRAVFWRVFDRAASELADTSPPQKSPIA